MHCSLAHIWNRKDRDNFFLKEPVYKGDVASNQPAGFIGVKRLLSAASSKQCQGVTQNTGQKFRINASRQKRKGSIKCVQKWKE